MAYAIHITRLRNFALAATVASATAMGGCASQMYGGTPSDMGASMTSPYAPGTYEPPYQVGAAAQVEEQPHEQDPQWTAEQKYEYRGGRDPVTGRARTQM